MQEIQSKTYKHELGKTKEHQLKKCNPIRPGGGRGLRGLDDQTHNCQSETSYSMVPKLCDF